MSMSVDGLISGMDTTALISRLVQAEAGPQVALKSRLSATALAASAYRTINTTFAAVRAAAESALKNETWTVAKATASSTSVSATAGSGAVAGSLTFTVDRLAGAHAVHRTDPAWTSPTSAAGFASLDVYAADGTTKKGTITVGGSQSLADAAAAINSSDHGLSASVVLTDAGTYALQVSARKTGAASAFSLQGAGTFLVNNAGQDAKLTIGTASKYSITSDTNTFTTALSGTTITVSRADPAVAVTVDVTADPDAVAAKMQTFVDALNSALSTVKTYTNNGKGSTAALKGEYNVSQLSGQLLDAVSFAVGEDRSPATVGFELKRDGTVAFDKAKFLAALAADPALAQQMIAGVPASTAPDGTPVAAVAGLGARVLAVAKAASDSATGTLVKLAESQDSLGKDIQARIEAWDVRLARREEMLSRQFSAMETALSALRNQSTWLAGQINSLPSAS